MLSAGYKLAIPAIKRLKTYALDHTATLLFLYVYFLSVFLDLLVLQYDRGWHEQKTSLRKTEINSFKTRCQLRSFTDYCYVMSSRKFTSYRSILIQWTDWDAKLPSRNLVMEIITNLQQHAYILFSQKIWLSDIRVDRPNITLIRDVKLKAQSISKKKKIYICLFLHFCDSTFFNSVTQCTKKFNFERVHPVVFS
jgi:hypothetical protein